MSSLCQGNHPEQREKDLGLNVCRRCRHLALVGIRTMPRAYDLLALQLIPTNNLGQPITMTRNPGINLDPRIVNTRATISALLRIWTRLAAHQQKLVELPDTNDNYAMSRFLMRHHDSICGWPRAHRYTDPIITVSEQARHLIDNNPIRTYPIGACPECDGTLIAQMRPHDPLLPAIIICDKTPTDENGQPQHAWTADKWSTLGRAMQ